MNDLTRDLFDLSAAVRYVAIYRDGKLESAQRPGIAGASASESDRYEEVIVNPAILTLVRQRGDIDCGGARFVIIRYGNFWTFIRPVPGGHVNVGMETSADPAGLAPAIEAVLARHGLA